MKISAIDINGNIKEYDVILTYYSEVFDKHYVVYTDNVYDDDNKLKVYISNYNPDNPETVVDNIENSEEYDKINIEINNILSTLKTETDKINF